MNFLVRDDDTNYFTSPQELEFCYSEIWNECPISISLISHVKGNWKYWVDEIYHSKSNTDWDKWKNDDTIYPIDQNEELVKFIKTKIKENKLCASLHAIHHRNEDPHPPKAVNNNYVGGAEFFTNQNLEKKVEDTISYLNELFDTKIKVFTPPQNLLSHEGYKAITSNNLNIIGGGISLLKKEKSTIGIVNLLKQLMFKVATLNQPYPYILKFHKHKEFINYHPLYPNTKIEDLITSFNRVHKLNGDFVLSTHYNEFTRPMTYDENIILKDVFYEFINYIKKKPNVNFVSANEFFE